MDQGIYTGTYKGREILGFVKEHTYIFDLKHNGRIYFLHAFSDVTYDDEVEELDIWINYSSETSIRQNWDIIESNCDE